MGNSCAKEDLQSSPKGELNGYAPGVDVNSYKKASVADTDIHHEREAVHYELQQIEEANQEKEAALYETPVYEVQQTVDVVHNNQPVYHESNQYQVPQHEVHGLVEGQDVNAHHIHHADHQVNHHVEHHADHHLVHHAEPHVVEQHVAPIVVDSHVHHVAPIVDNHVHHAAPLVDNHVHHVENVQTIPVQTQHYEQVAPILASNSQTVERMLQEGTQAVHTQGTMDKHTVGEVMTHVEPVKVVEYTTTVVEQPAAHLNQAIKEVTQTPAPVELVNVTQAVNQVVVPTEPTMINGKKVKKSKGGCFGGKSKAAKSSKKYEETV